MSMGSIMLCLEQLNIGGVETYVINQALTFKKMGYEVVVLGKNGIYTKYLESNGIFCFNFEYQCKDHFDYTKIMHIVDIIKKYNVKEAHINQFTLIQDVVMACILTNIPYVAYIHVAPATIDDIELNPFDWFEKKYTTYKELFNLFFKYAYKIISIAPKVLDYVSNRYNIDRQKMITIPNSIDFENYKSYFNVKSINNILIISRLEKEKLKSIFKAIDFYAYIRKVCNRKLHLDIVGNGKEYDNIKRYVIKNGIPDEEVTFLGAITSVSEQIEKNDIVLGLDRCMLETIAMKRIAIISSYDGNLKGLVEGENLLKEVDENFCGLSLENVSIEDLAKYLLSLNEKEIIKITENNYILVKDKLDIFKNIYVANLSEYRYFDFLDGILKEVLKIDNELGIINCNNINIIEKNWRDHLAYKEFSENRIKELQKELDLRNNELVSIRSSRYYKFMQKMKKIFRKR